MSIRSPRATGPLALAIATLLLLAGCSKGSGTADTPTPPQTVLAGRSGATTVSGPISGGDKGHLFGAALTDLDRYGYVEEEFFLEGAATTYGPTPGTSLGADGEWSVEETGSVPYKTRMVVRRPADPADANGTVLVVWMDDTAGYEMGDYGDPQLLSRGYTQVFVSTQRDGLEGDSINGANTLPGLLAWDPSRYGTLNIPTNDASFDIFSQAAEAVGPDRTLGDGDPLGGIDVQRTIAYGKSEAAGWLLTYYDAVQPSQQVFDGFMPVMHFGTGEPLASDVEMPPTLVFRIDGTAPVLLVNSETEAEAYAPSWQPDSDHFRLWEYAGVNHSFGTPGAERLAAFGLQNFEFSFYTKSCDRPLDTLDARFVLPAGVVALDTWIRDGVAPTPAEPITVVDGTIVRDSLGIAVGGIKIPQVAVPTSTHGAPNGVRETDLACYLQGYEIPFDPATIAQLYPTHDDYVAAISAAATDLEMKGFILPEDAAAERNAADQRPVGGPQAP